MAVELEDKVALITGGVVVSDSISPSVWSGRVQASLFLVVIRRVCSQRSIACGFRRPRVA